MNRRSALIARALGWLVLAGAMAFATTPVPAAATGAKVRFRFEGKTGNVVTEGLFCGAMRIERLEGNGPRPLTLAIGPQCVCECAPLPAPRLRRAIDVAKSPVLEWDGRQGEESEHRSTAHLGSPQPGRRRPSGSSRFGTRHPGGTERRSAWSAISHRDAHAAAIQLFARRCLRGASRTVASTSAQAIERPRWNSSCRPTGKQMLSFARTAA